MPRRNGAQQRAQVAFGEEPLDDATLLKSLDDWQEAKDELKPYKNAFSAINKTTKALIEQKELAGRRVSRRSLHHHSQGSRRKSYRVRSRKSAVATDQARQDLTMVAPARLAVSVFVRGRPVPKGSLRVRHIHGERLLRGCICRQWVVEESDARLAEWRALIATAVKRALRQEPPFAGPVQSTLTFLYARPKSHTAAQRAIPWCYGQGEGDIEKLVRAVHDALSDCATWGNDCQAARLIVEKRYCDGFEVPGVQIE